LFVGLSLPERSGPVADSSSDRTVAQTKYIVIYYLEGVQLTAVGQTGCKGTRVERMMVGADR